MIRKGGFWEKKGGEPLTKKRRGKKKKKDPTNMTLKFQPSGAQSLTRKKRNLKGIAGEA